MAFLEIGIKTAEQILRKNPNHGDTQAMKALIMSNQGQLEEAFVLAKTALKNDMKSHVCWHVFGLLYRAEKNYE
jgi:N-alpha-acetyltransferase 15/16, NatA auxiliary subunit